MKPEPPLLKLFHAPTSPYVRKVMVVAHWLGLSSRIELLDCAANPVARDERITAYNPLAKIPAALSADGEALFDSRVICEYLDDWAAGGLFPTGARRWPALTRQALGDGLLDAALLARYERQSRPAQLWSQPWYHGQMQKIDAALDEIERQAPVLAELPFEIGTLTLGCALGYLDFRFDTLDWRRTRPRAAAWFAEFDLRPPMAETRPHS